jgi:GNAT superfamily N-acetyltransferase
LALVARRIYARFCCEVLLYSFDLTRDLPRAASDLPLELKPLSEVEVGPYLDLRRDENRPAVQARLRRGDLCLSSWSDGRLIGAVWVRFDRMWISEIASSMPLRPGDAYGYASFTEPAYRRRGAATVLSRATLEHLKTAGYRRALGYVMRDNAAGRAALRTLGFDVVGRVRWFHLGRMGLEVTQAAGARTRLRAHVRPRGARE